MVELEHLPDRVGEADGPSSGQDAEQLRRLVKEVILPELTPSLRIMIREEMQNVLLLSGCTRPGFRFPGNQKQAITSRFQLHFSDELPETIFTGNTVKSKSNIPLQVFLTDTNKRKITSGSLSTIKIEILVLAGDFGHEEQGSWTEEEFNKNVQCERKDRRPLLMGNRFIPLKDGVGNLPSISFTDNSKWTKAQKFRLGARVLQSDHVEERVQEAISEAFCVNDQRGEYTMKHHIPLLEDDVWRLKNIRKDGPYHRRLLESGIIKVQDFLKSLSVDPDKLCSILFGKKIAKKQWKDIVQHAQKCDLGHKLYSYIVPGQQVVLIFNSVLQVVGAGFGDSRWQPLDQLPAHQKDMVNSLKQIAYGNHNAIGEITELANSHLECPPALPATYPEESNQSGNCCTNNQISHEAYETDALVDLRHSLVESIPVYVEGSNHMDDHQQACFKENYMMDGAFDGEACSTMESCRLNEVFEWNTGGHGTEPCSHMFKGQHISLVSSAKLKVNIKSGTSIQKCRSARNSRIHHIKWVKLLAAVRFGLFRTLAAARHGDLPDNCQSPTVTGINQHGHDSWGLPVIDLDGNGIWLEDWF